MTPRGGTGLNTAIRDGFDIGWKLAWALRGWGGEPLLESYERERRPVAEYNTRRSIRGDGSILGTALGLNADIGGRIAHVWVPRDGGLVSTLDLLSDGLTLFVGPDWDGAAPTRDAEPPVTIERLDAFSASGLGLTPAGSLLARPDGYPAALFNNVGNEHLARRATTLKGGARMLGDHPIDTVLLATDLAESKAFYADTLGLEILTEGEVEITYRCGGDSRLAVTRSTTGTADEQTEAGWRVKDLAAELAELRPAASRSRSTTCRGWA